MLFRAGSVRFTAESTQVRLILELLVFRVGLKNWVIAGCLQLMPQSPSWSSAAVLKTVLAPPHTDLRIRVMDLESRSDRVRWSWGNEATKLGRKEPLW